MILSGRRGRPAFAVAVRVAAIVIVCVGMGCRRSPVERPASSPGAPAAGATPATPSGSTASDAEIDAAIAATEEPRSSTEPLKAPPELMLYADRKRFLAIQAAAASTEGYERPHDLAALARLIRAGELQVLPELGKDYVLDRVGEDAREDPLAHFDVDSGLEVPLVADAGEAESVAAKLAGSGRAADAKRAALMRRLYGAADSRAMLAQEYEAITSLARDLEGESYDLEDAEDREAFQSRLLSSLRPAGRDVMLQLAQKYHARFPRLLPVVSMVRTERYQRLLSRVNANATHIELAPHTTGEAFDITYRSMPSDEQNLLMSEIAALEEAGKVEALRERRNCFHVFAFATGRRPGEPAVTAARAAIVADQAEEEPERTKRKPRRVRTTRHRAR